VLLVALVVAVPLGRWEGDRRQDEQQRGIERVRTAVGEDVLGSGLKGVARVFGLQCLLYRGGGYDYGYELCLDGSGRLVRAVDATGPGDAVHWDLGPDAGRAAVLLPPERLAEPSALLDRREVVGRLTTVPHQRVAACVLTLRRALAPVPGPRAAPQAREACALAVTVTADAVAAAATLGPDGLAAAIAALRDPAEQGASLADRLAGADRGQTLAAVARVDEALAAAAAGLARARTAVGLSA
jgi:hypothetical protein